MPPKKAWEDEDESSSEEESVSPPPVAVRRRFDDEEDSDNVADNWEEAEDSEAEREKAKKAAAAKAKADAEAAANKKSKSQRVEEHREAARRRRAVEEEEEEADTSSSEDAGDKRARLRQSEQEADLKHAQDLLDNVGLGPNKSRTAANKATIIEDQSHPGQTIDLSALPLFKPATKSQFEALSTTLVPLLTAASNKPHYALWLVDFVKKIAADLPSAEIKKAASALTALSNEKMKEEKALEKGGKKSKAAKTKTTLAAGRDVGRGVADTTVYEDDLGDDDFM